MTASSVLMLMLFLVTLLAACFLATVFLHLTVEARRLRPITIGLLAGVLTAMLGRLYANIVPAAAIRVIVLPLITAAAATALACTKDDWSVFASGRAEISAKRARDVLAILFGVGGAVLAGSTSIGKSILVALNQDVIGNTAGELIEIRIAGGVFGFLVGAFLFLFVWACISRLRQG